VKSFPLNWSSHYLSSQLAGMFGAVVLPPLLRLKHSQDWLCHVSCEPVQDFVPNPRHGEEPGAAVVEA
jgi:hypothetical protein